MRMRMRHPPLSALYISIHRVASMSRSVLRFRYFPLLSSPFSETQSPSPPPPPPTWIASDRDPDPSIAQRGASLERRRAH
ncbi:hypothetical protein MUK42_35800 [Musa troglodytarum]|uniref:Uncharacterized protein n=1 Tax=Musa troglodytarum TaxID=320322 RepID=A0A9E7H0M3_9LILI|nr:hypothetical protein MUK42_35800 [Musa troglodytarum]